MLRSVTIHRLARVLSQTLVKILLLGAGVLSKGTPQEVGPRSSWQESPWIGGTTSKKPRVDHAGQAAKVGGIGRDSLVTPRLKLKPFTPRFSAGWGAPAQALVGVSPRPDLTIKKWAPP